MKQQQRIARIYGLHQRLLQASANRQMAAQHQVSAQTEVLATMRLHLDAAEERAADAVCGWEAQAWHAYRQYLADTAASQEQTIAVSRQVLEERVVETTHAYQDSKRWEIRSLAVRDALHAAALRTDFRTADELAITLGRRGGADL